MASFPALAVGLSSIAFSLAPVAPVGVPGSGLTRLSGGSPFAASCEAPGVQRGAEVEPTVAASPAAPGTLIAAWQQDRYRRGSAAGLLVSVSRDGGASWAPASVPRVTDCARGRLASDPWVTIGPDGIAYLTSLSVSPGRTGIHTRVAVSISRDGGVTWSLPLLLDAGGNQFNDKPAVTADPARPGRAYLVWTLEGAAFLSRTLDAGVTWSPPRLIGRARGPGGLLSSTISVLPGGALLHTYLAYGVGPPRVEAARSVDGGASWSQPRLVAPVPNAGVLASGTRPPVRSTPFSGTGPAVTASGDVYEALAGRDRSGRGIVELARSVDGGRSWSRPGVAVRQPGTAFAPAVAAGANGLALSYYAAEPGGQASFWIARSRDGVHWVRRRVAAPFSLRRSPVSGRAAFLGDYTGLAAIPRGGFAAAFAVGPPLASSGPSDVLLARDDRP